MLAVAALLLLGWLIASAALALYLGRFFAAVNGR